MNTVAVIDYGMGNLRSVGKAIEHVAPRAQVALTSDAGEIARAGRVVFPATDAPSPRRVSATTRPIPFVAPVTSARLPASPRSIGAPSAESRVRQIPSLARRGRQSQTPDVLRGDGSGAVQSPPRRFLADTGVANHGVPGRQDGARHGWHARQGRAIAEALHGEGANVVLNGRSEEKGQQAIAEMGGDDRLLFVAGDVTDQAVCEALVEATVDHYGSIDILVNNAGGVGTPAVVAEVPDEEWNRVLNTYRTCATAMLILVMMQDPIP